MAFIAEISLFPPLRCWPAADTLLCLPSRFGAVFLRSRRGCRVRSIRELVGHKRNTRHRSSVVEHTLGKGEVTGSSPVGGFKVIDLPDGPWSNQTSYGDIASPGPAGPNQVEDTTVCRCAGRIPRTVRKHLETDQNGQGYFCPRQASRQRRHHRSHRPRQDDSDGGNHNASVQQGTG